ncbi:hypothetical protein [Enterococcus sp. DIV0756]|uniref:DUF2922 family protein n=1 Tax=Enterococcus sp. DIV0756 TaxID=2774636 RepID=UPI003F234D6C
MRTETTDLVALFGKNNGGRHSWRYKDVDTSLSAAEIREACELLTTLDLFEQDGVKLFDSALSAKFVTTIETIIFDLEHEPEETQPEVPRSDESTCEEVPCFEVPDELENNPTRTQNDDNPFLVPAFIQSDGHHYERLTQLETSNNTNSVIRGTTESLPCKKEKQPINPMDADCQKPTAVLTNEVDKPLQDTVGNTRFTRWIQKIRSRNKEAPDITPRE